MYAKIDENGVIQFLTTKKSDLVIDVTDLGDLAKSGKKLIDCYKEQLKKQLWKLLPQKVKNAKKVIIGKPEMSNEELEIQLELYWQKYQDAKDGKDVFEAQATAMGLTQEKYRDLVISKGDAFIQMEKQANDRVEMVRSKMEDNIKLAQTKEDIQLLQDMLKTIDTFTLETPLEDIINALKFKE